MKRSLLLGVCALSLLAGISAKATPLYDFAFSITPDGGGSITGEIEGLADNATSAPLDILITSDSDPNDPLTIGPDGYSLDANGYVQSQYVANTFVVADDISTGHPEIMGTGTGADVGTGLIWYQVLDPDPYAAISFSFNAYASQNGEVTQSTDLSGTTTSLYYDNSDGFAGTDYSEGTLSTIPEPGSWGAGILLAVAAGMVRRRLFPRSDSCQA